MPRQNDYLHLLLEVTQTITASLDPQEVFTLIVTKIPEVIQVDAATIRLLDPSRRHLILEAASGLSEAYLNRGPIDAEKSVMAALQGQPIAIADADQDTRIQYPEAAHQEGIKSILVAPIPIRGQISGILRLLTRTRREFQPLEIAFVAALAEQCGIAIENARIYAEQQRQLDYFKAVCQISKHIGETRHLDTVLDLVVNTLPEVMRLKACTIRLIESKTGRLELKAAHGLSQAYLQRGPLDDELATYFILKGEPVVIPDATTDIHTLYHKEAASEGVGSILAVPITVKGETIGVLRLLTDEVRHFTPGDIRFAMAVAEQSGVAIQNAIDYQQLSDALAACRQSDQSGSA
ncbi:putative GAF sensor protein [Desulfosarcina cetonica]|uniref:GAF domain-containing protein n=1 Tax=Desulfosarcina cetonica TaxID=90730 RepID=UPI0006D2677C|nr:GAF domain-containing protein [Desulfosarcina cetonica]VTR63851.1 putative GAF sensor protein [Desulfosarcina cetonica]